MIPEQEEDLQKEAATQWEKSQFQYPLHYRTGDNKRMWFRGYISKGENDHEEIEALKQAYGLMLTAIKRIERLASGSHYGKSESRRLDNISRLCNSYQELLAAALSSFKSETAASGYGATKS